MMQGVVTADLGSVTCGCFVRTTNTCWARLSSVSEKPFYLLQEAHAERGRGAINHQFGMFAPKSLGNVAVPADGPMGAQHFLEFFGGDLDWEGGVLGKGGD